jgi:hypothetical protein
MNIEINIPERKKMQVQEFCQRQVRQPSSDAGQAILGEIQVYDFCVRDTG